MGCWICHNCESVDGVYSIDFDMGCDICGNVDMSDFEYLE
jgi:hypothetical protein